MKKNKRETISRLFWKIWEWIVIGCHIIFILGLIGLYIGDSSLFKRGLILVIISWIITGALVSLEDVMKKKYVNKHKKQFKVDNSFFGTCIFEQKTDEFYMELVESTNKMRFGSYRPEIWYTGNDRLIPKALENLEHIYIDASNILEQIYVAIFDQCKTWNEVDTDGIPVDLEFVKKYCSVSKIDMEAEDEKNITIRLTTYLVDPKSGPLLGDHNIVMEIDCNTSEISFNLEG